MFKLFKKSNKSKARLTQLKTNHGTVEGPFFMPDATLGFVRSLDAQDLKSLGLPAMVVNTLHLHSRPGLPIINKFKGLHGFMNWPGPLLSDSGGYQVYSLLHKSKIGKI